MGLFWVGSYRDNGKENGSYKGLGFRVWGLGFRVYFGWVYVGIMEKKMETIGILGLYTVGVIYGCRVLGFILGTV